MTTIAYSARIRKIASDRQVTQSGYYFGDTPHPKFLEVGRFIFCFAGSLDGIDHLRERLSEVEDFVDFRSVVNFFKENYEEGSHVEVFVIDRENPSKIGVCSTDPDGTNPGGSITDIKNGYFTLGSGSKIALGAMAAGADPREAVLIASDYDTHTGGSIDVLSF